VGFLVGSGIGDFVGRRGASVHTGALVGIDVGLLVGEPVGALTGTPEGIDVGILVGLQVDGSWVGMLVGL